MEKQSDLYFLKILQDAITSLNKIDELVESNSTRQSAIDLELCDLLHLIENEEISDAASPKIIKRIHELRQIRRSLRNEYELIIKYNEIKERLSFKENRQFVIAEIQKRIKNLNQEYKNRILTQEQIDELLKDDSTKITETKKKRKRSEESKKIDEQIMELLEKGKSQSEIAKILYMTQPSISMRVKRIKEAQNA